jgi:tyrosine-specific transport protein
MKNKVLGGSLLVCGTTIGAGMLALPIETGLAGFIPSLISLVFFWAFMYFTALLTLEVNMWMDKGSNLISMAQKTLGNSGQALAWVVYLFLLYSLTTAYLAAGAPILAGSVEMILGIEIPVWITPVPFLLIFGLFVYLGTRAVDYVNRVLVAGMFVTFGALCIALSRHTNFDYLLHTDFPKLSKSLSFMLISFGYHIIIPSLRTYLNSDIKKIKQSIFWGSVIPIGAYIVWEYLVLGALPIEGPGGVESVLASREPLMAMIAILQNVVNNPWMVFCVRALTFFVIVTSFLGVSLSLSDFLSDGLKIDKTISGKLIVTCLTFFPPLCFSITGHNVFILALNYGGAFGVALLLGVFPPLMVWRGRYIKNFQGKYQVKGGKISLIFVLFVSSLVVLNTIFEQLI